MKTYYRVLAIAGSDSGGGAGIQADLKTFSALGCYGMSVITALTAQNTVAVTAIYSVPPACIAQQIDAVFEDIGVDAVKIGMLHSPDIIRVVARQLRQHQATNIVIDPVMVAKSGARLLQDEAVATLKSELLPLAAVLTPNLPEAEVLLGRSIQDEAGLRTACIELSRVGPEAVLLKGGHLAGKNSQDLLFIKPRTEPMVLSAERIETRNTHGTGCTLSSAIAAFLARGYNIPEAARAAKEYVTLALRAGADYTLGNGHGPVHHFFDFWDG